MQSAYMNRGEPILLHVRSCFRGCSPGSYNYFLGARVLLRIGWRIPTRMLGCATQSVPVCEEGSCSGQAAVFATLCPAEGAGSGSHLLTSMS